MNYKERHIESLMQLFMRGESSLEQEKELSDYFATTHNVPKDWEDYKRMFAYFEDGMPLENIRGTHRQYNMAHTLWWALAAAAIAAITIIISTIGVKETAIKPKEPKPITVKRPTDSTKIITLEFPKHPIIPLVAKQDKKSINKTREEKDKNTTHKTILDSIEIEREKGEVELAQQELMADRFIIEQELEEIIDEQYANRTRTLQVQQILRNENPQYIQVVFK